MRTALIRDGAIVNIVEAPDGWTPEDKALTALPIGDVHCGPGWSYDGNQFHPPPQPPLPPPTTEERVAAMLDWAEQFRAAVQTATSLDELKAEDARHPALPTKDTAAATVEVVT